MKKKNNIIITTHPHSVWILYSNILLLRIFIYKHYWQCIFYSFACFVALSYTVPFQIFSKYWSIAHLISYLCFYLWLLLLYFIFFVFVPASSLHRFLFIFICFIRLKFSTISSYSSTNQLVSTSDVCFVDHHNSLIKVNWQYNNDHYLLWNKRCDKWQVFWFSFLVGH